MSKTDINSNAKPSVPSSLSLTTADLVGPIEYKPLQPLSSIIKNGYLTLHCNLSAYEAQVLDVVDFTHVPFGWHRKLFIVLSSTLVGTKQTNSEGTATFSNLGVDLFLGEVKDTPENEAKASGSVEGEASAVDKWFRTANVLRDLLEKAVPVDEKLKALFVSLAMVADEKTGAKAPGSVDETESPDTPAGLSILARKISKVKSLLDEGKLAEAMYEHMQCTLMLMHRTIRDSDIHRA